jgi:hypothetical protein
MKSWAWGAGMVMVAGMLVLPKEARADYRQQAGSFCLPITSTYQDLRSNTGAIGNGGAAAMRMVCPILDDSALSKASLYGAYIDVYDGTSAASTDARSCITYGYTLGGSCGPATVSSAPGMGVSALYLNIAVWQSNPSDYGYILVNLPPAQSGRASAVHGYYLYR